MSVVLPRKRLRLFSFQQRYVAGPAAETEGEFDHGSHDAI